MGLLKDEKIQKKGLVNLCIDHLKLYNLRTEKILEENYQFQQAHCQYQVTTMQLESRGQERESGA